jgi:magnesium transporter
MMTKTVPWPVSYGIFSLGLGTVGWLTYLVLRAYENRGSHNLGKNN